LFLTGAVPQESTMKDMLAEAPGPLNFTMFLSLFSEKLSGMYQLIDDLI